MQCKICHERITAGQPYDRQKMVHRSCLYPVKKTEKFSVSMARTKRILPTPEWVWERFGWTAAIVELMDGTYAIVEHPVPKGPMKVLARLTTDAAARVYFNGNPKS